MAGTAPGVAEPGQHTGLPRLSPGPHLGYIVGFERQPRAQRKAAAAHWETAVEVGMDIGRIQVDWAGLEPKPGRPGTCSFQRSATKRVCALQFPTKTMGAEQC